ncbi:hypothetical protein F511_43087 [Dorcoceras hygrometricum]|uniref:Uncharacterized protein n=1 Tax=Dorcoceras hygrometricum TaxID=472368 RepID=A0A2Z7AYB9_9LAMI|nr:hypothetical protein F511_43087 [Dorcoceras hygrometricum]
MTDWFLQELSVIPRGSWGDVARRFTMVRWGCMKHSSITQNPTHQAAAPHFFLPSRPHVPRAARRRATRRLPSCRRTCSDHCEEEIPFVINSSGLLVQTDEGAVIPVVDRIRRTQPPTVEVPVSL